MSSDYNIMAGGEAGQGIQSLGAVITKFFARAGFHVFADQDYESRVRGGHNFFRVRAAGQEVLALSEALDCLIAMNGETALLHAGEVKQNGTIIAEGDVAPGDNRVLRVPLTKMAEDTTGSRLATNTVAAGCAIGMAGGDFGLLEAVLREEFARGGEASVAGNIAAARAGYDYVQKSGGKPVAHMKLIPPQGKREKRLLLNGNEAVALGALVSGCRFLAGYPMTPASSIMEFFAGRGAAYGAVTLHVEDEISAMNMVVGAGYTGVRAMTATSGGGFSLMVEGLALAGMTETPVVIVLGQRPGPATGLPTRTEQGELEFALHAGHGEFPRAVLAPATVEEAFHVTARAFNLAEKYQTPVIILTDHHLASSYSAVPRFDLGALKIDRGQLLADGETTGDGEYKRYLVTESGVSPRAIPGGRALVVADSDEHDEAGHMIEDAATRNQQNAKRLRKRNGLHAEVSPPLVGGQEDAEITLVGWGSTYGAISEAAARLSENGVRVGTLHLSQLYPFPAEAVSKVLGSSARSIVIENNATSPLSRLIRTETGIQVSRQLGKADGRPFSPQYLLRELEKEVA